MRRGGGAPGKDGGGEGDKVMGPLFPRLHVNDTTLKGGGPRAPPRNKMALYEQFSVPSQRFNATANANANVTTPHRPAASYAVSSAAAGQLFVKTIHALHRRCALSSRSPAISRTGELDDGQPKARRSVGQFNRFLPNRNCQVEAEERRRSGVPRCRCRRRQLVSLILTVR